MTPVIAAALLCLILPAFLLGAYIFLSSRRYHKTVGTVVGQDVVHGDMDQLSAPIVEFHAPDGTKITFTEKIHSSESILDILGGLASRFVLKKDPNRVVVLYDPGDPHKARVGTLGNLYMLPLVLLAFGLILILSTFPGFTDSLGKLGALLDKLPF